MLARAKQLAVRAVARRPIYRMLPPGALRTYAALKYHGENSDHDTLVRYIRSAGGIPTRPLSTALIAAKAVFRAGQDDLLAAALTTLAARYPGAPGIAVLQADLHSYHGDYEQALAVVAQADQRRACAATTARVVTLSYRIRSQADADAAAVAAVSRYPRSPEVLWPVATNCASAEQYQRVAQAWQQRTEPTPTDLPKVVRQLATAAGRAGDVTAAADWYHRVIELLLNSRQPAPQPPVTTLAGLGGRRAIEDLCRVLDGAGVPFFFAAGTALGLIRAGRVLGADNDIDVGVFDQDWDRPALIKLFQADPAFDLDLHPQTQKIGLRHRGGSPVDIFRFYDDGDRVWHDGVFVRWWNTPFTVTRQKIGGQSVPLPADHERYLTENYGDWRTPWPGFDAFTDDAPNREVTWPAYQRVHLIRRAWQQLAAGDRAGAAQELRKAGEDALADRVGPTG